MMRLARMKLRRWKPPEPAGVSVGTSVGVVESVGSVVGSSVVLEVGLNVAGGDVCFGFLDFKGPTVTSGPDCCGPDCSGPDCSGPTETATLAEGDAAGVSPTHPYAMSPRR